ncbi:hypothetical protein A5768_11380 [Mycolicibacterium fortuitum]|uniref:hypothetical protein n=1 Tax=Mycolicibacterium fortuitum TaxID=1766 RepID=UPI0007EA9770|nr:hypothetical protein [Mycolicibacterium fortuitum]OBG11813.1 hypothetical protein A5768_11380 [Mycolicibacterium fortuitum]
MTTNSVDAQPEDIVARLLEQATEILDTPHNRSSETAINYARACAEVANAYAAQGAAISAAKTAEAAGHTVGILTQILRTLGAAEEDFRVFAHRSAG